VTENDWLASRDPQAMLTFLSQRGITDDRKHRLFACACCRRIWDQFPDERNRDLVAVVENYPDHTFDDPEIRDPACASSARELEFRDNPAYWVVKALGRGFYKMTAPVSAAVVAARALDILAPGGAETDGNGRIRQRAEAQQQAALLRDVFGNPFQVVMFSPEWRTDTAVSLAGQMYEAREFSAVPILADALQDAGCDDPAVLDHCRGFGRFVGEPPAGSPHPSCHVRGCWVVDLVLDKE
jgi:hypothetical protein